MIDLTDPDMDGKGARHKGIRYLHVVIKTSRARTSGGTCAPALISSAAPIGGRPREARPAGCWCTACTG